MPFAWSPAVLEDLHRLYVREKRSASETARLLGGGLTRGAVLGKAQRMGWSKPPEARARPQSPRSKRGGAARRKRAAPLPKRIPLPPLREVAPPGTPRPWTERLAGECAFPVGEPAEPGRQLSCCAPVQRGCAYCAAHRSLMLIDGSAMTDQDREAILEIARRAA